MKCLHALRMPGNNVAQSVPPLAHQGSDLSQSLLLNCRGAQFPLFITASRQDFITIPKL